MRSLARYSRLLDTTTKDRRAGIASKFVERGAVDSRSAENQVGYRAISLFHGRARGRVVVNHSFYFPSYNYNGKGRDKAFTK